MDTALRFPKFPDHVYDGETVRLDLEDGLSAVATVHQDDDMRPSCRSSGGFWPSLDPDDVGFIGEGKTEADLAAERARMEAIMTAWKNSEWWFCGVAVQIFDKDGEPLTGEYDHALWGIEANYPDSDNAYLTEVADDMLREALKAAREKLADKRIREAAPALLAACETALIYLGDNGTDDSPEARDTRRIVRAAIAKARGED